MTGLRRKLAIGVLAAGLPLAGLGTYIVSPVFAEPPTSAPSGEEHERHPQIRAAIRALEKAKAHLEKADHDFGGHRVDAIKSIDESLRQLRMAIEFDKE